MRLFLSIIWQYAQHRSRFMVLCLSIVPLLSVSVVLGLTLLTTLGEPPAPPTNIGPSLVQDQDKDEGPITISGDTHYVYLPLTAVPDSCELNSDEEALANLIINNPSQGRPSMACDPILSQVAREKAMDMAQRSYFDHTNPDGFGPNYLVRNAGYSLPSWYSNAADGNNIESIAAGYNSAGSVWTGWLNSEGHRAHVLAESSFWQSQTNYGVGYYYDASSPYKHYWVFLSAPPQE